MTQGSEGSGSGGVSNTPPQETTPTPRPRTLGHRVDALTLAFRVAFSDDARAVLATAAEQASRYGAAELELGPRGEPARWSLSLRVTRSPGRYYLETGDLRALVDLDAQGRQKCDDGGPDLPAWTVEVIPRAIFLARSTWRAALDLCRALAWAFGDVAEERLRRLDLAADFEGWELHERDARAIVKPGRARTASYHPEEPMAAVRLKARTFRDAARDVTGFTVAAGGPVMGRIYDKTAELALPGNESKADVERAGWSEHGWTGGRVVRVEVQLRSQALGEMNARDPEALGERIDEIWSYFHTRWMRLAIPDSATRLSRCRTDPRWLAVQAITFEERRPPLVRVRLRGGASWGQSLGTVLSVLAGGQVLPRLAKHDPETGEAWDPDSIAALPPPERRAWLGARLESLAGLWVREMLDLADERVPDAAAQLAARWPATRARLALMPRDGPIPRPDPPPRPG